MEDDQGDFGCRYALLLRGKDILSSEAWGSEVGWGGM